MTAPERTRLDRMQALLHVLSASDPPPSEEAGDEVWDPWVGRHAADGVLAGMLTTAIHHGRHSPGDVRSARAESRRAGSRLSPEQLEEAYRLLAER